MTPEELAHLRALADAASAGPWRFNTQTWGWYNVDDIVIQTKADGDFVAAARGAVPRLLDVVASQREELERLRDVDHEANQLVDEVTRLRGEVGRYWPIVAAAREWHVRDGSDDQESVRAALDVLWNAVDALLAAEHGGEP